VEGPRAILIGMAPKIDGSYGEGGGLVLRTALALAAIFREFVEIQSARGGRNQKEDSRLVYCPGNTLNKSHRSRKPFSSDIEHFRNETEAALSVEDHELFDPPQAECRRRRVLAQSFTTCRDPAKGS
jgi:beta-galactosidase/beta-glucuronidase